MPGEQSGRASWPHALLLTIVPDPPIVTASSGPVPLSVFVHVRPPSVVRQTTPTAPSQAEPPTRTPRAVSANAIPWTTMPSFPPDAGRTVELAQGDGVSTVKEALAAADAVGAIVDGAVEENDAPVQPASSTESVTAPL